MAATKKWVLLSFLVLMLAASLSAFYYYHSRGQKKAFRLLDAKMASGVTDKFKPIDPKEVFPEKIQNIFFWIEWENAEVGTELVMKLDYLTDEIHVVDYNFKIPRKRGSGSLALKMPEGKSFPSGDYQVTLNRGKRVLKKLEFKVE